MCTRGLPFTARRSSGDSVNLVINVFVDCLTGYKIPRMESPCYPTSFYIKIEFENRRASGIVIFVYTVGELISSPGKQDMSEAAETVSLYFWNEMSRFQYLKTAHSHYRIC